MRKRQIRVTVPMVQRMRALRGIGLSCEAIARVIELDFGARPAKRTVSTYTDSPFTGWRAPKDVAGVGTHNGVAPPGRTA